MAKRRLSKEARARISAAQKARWNKGKEKEAILAEEADEISFYGEGFALTVNADRELNVERTDEETTIHIMKKAA